MLLQNVHRMCLDCPPEGTESRGRKQKSYKLSKSSNFKWSQNEGSISAVIGPYEYWHYLCDGFDDRGWGCGYRTLQTIVSWIKMHFSQESLPKVEHIHKYQVNRKNIFSWYKFQLHLQLLFKRVRFVNITIYHMLIII